MIDIDPLRFDRGLRAKAEKTIKGHRGYVRHGKRIDCECGWHTSTYWGAGATGQCSYEFYDHKLNCLVAQAREAVS